MSDTREIWVWVALPAGDAIGTVFDYGPSLGRAHTPLQNKSREVVDLYRAIAEAHCRATGQRLALRRYVVAEEIEFPVPPT